MSDRAAGSPAPASGSRGGLGSADARDAPLLSVRDLSVGYPGSAGMFHAVRNVNLSLARGEVLGLVGESGSGKTTIGLSIIGLVPAPGRILGGEIVFDGRALSAMSDDARRRLRGDRISMIFQNPMSSLNPTLTIETQIVEALQAHREMDRRAARDRARELMELVGIADPARRLRAYPHELSGGMRQRVMIAMAVGLNPDVLIADEPTTALDVTIQAQILWLLEDLRTRLGMAIVYITHNLAVAANLCQSIAVCYAGQIVEQAPTSTLFAAPAHPYTRGLIEAVPTDGWRTRPIRPIAGQAPTTLGERQSCSFAPRCPWVFDRCLVEAPQPIAIGVDHDARCFKYDADAASSGPRVVGRAAV